MKKIALATLCAAAALSLSACVSTRKLYDLKDPSLSAPAQNTVRICNMLTWIYNTCSDYDDMNETLKEIGITREELQTLKFKGNYEKPFARQFSAEPDNSDETEIYSAAKSQAQKIARLMLKNLPDENSSESEE